MKRSESWRILCVLLLVTYLCVVFAVIYVCETFFLTAPLHAVLSTLTRPSFLWFRSPACKVPKSIGRR